MACLFHLDLWFRKGGACIPPDSHSVESHFSVLRFGIYRIKAVCDRSTAQASLYAWRMDRIKSVFLEHSSINNLFLHAVPPNDSACRSGAD